MTPVGNLDRMGGYQNSRSQTLPIDELESAVLSRQTTSNINGDNVSDVPIPPASQQPFDVNASDQPSEFNHEQLINLQDDIPQQDPPPYSETDQQSANPPALVRQPNVSARTSSLNTPRGTITGMRGTSDISAGGRSYSERSGHVQTRIARPGTTKSRLDEALAYIKTLEEYNAHANNQIQYLKDERGRNEEEHLRLESGLRQLQQHVFRRFESPDWKPASNDEIRTKLRQLDNSVKVWSKTHGVSKLNVLESVIHEQGLLLDVHEKLWTAVIDFTKPDSNKSFTSIPDGRGWVVIQAYIIHRLYIDIFDHPFFGVGIDTSEHIDAQETSGDPAHVQSERRAEDMRRFPDSLRMLYNKFWACNRQDAISWRVQALRQLRPHIRSDDPKAVEKYEMCEETTRSRNTAVESLVSKYLFSAIRPLILDPDLDAVTNGLLDIVSTAAELSYSLWTQKIHLVPRTLGDLEEVFAYNDPLMEAHALHNKHIDEDRTRLDGKPILLVTHPALALRGYEDVMDDSAQTVLKKAVCWMGQMPGSDL